MFWLVQRVVRKDHPSGDPSPLAPVRSAAACFDRMFGCEYMGSSEFELGEVSSAYQRMNGLDLQVRPVEITRGNVTCTVYFVAADDPKAYTGCKTWDFDDVTSFDQAIAEFRLWFSQRYLSSLEQSNFEYYFADKFPDYWGDDRTTCVWWSLRDNIAWTLRDNIAQELLRAFKPDPSWIAPEGAERSAAT